MTHQTRALRAPCADTSESVTGHTSAAQYGVFDPNTGKPLTVGQDGRPVTAQPRLLELCACEGGATKGLQRAGWHVTAVDLDGAALARNPADLTVKADALEFLAEHGDEFDAVWASFPCQKWCANGANPASADYPDLITPGRELLNATGKPWVMENVPKAPLRRDLILCGTMFGLTALDTDWTRLHLDRHRVFESNVPLFLPAGASPVSPHRCGPRKDVQWAGVYGGARKDKVEARKVRKGGYVPADAGVQSDLLGGVEWMTFKGRRECIPPVYAQWVGLLLHEALAHRDAAPEGAAPERAYLANGDDLARGLTISQDAAVA